MGVYIDWQENDPLEHSETICLVVESTPSNKHEVNAVAQLIVNNSPYKLVWGATSGKDDYAQLISFYGEECTHELMMIEINKLIDELLEVDK